MNEFPYSQSINDKGLDIFTFFLFCAFLTVILLSTIAFEATSNILAYFLGFGLLMSILLLESYMVERREFSFYLTIPILISATQNLYLGLVSPYASDTQIQLMVVTNFIFSIVLLLILFIRTTFRFNQSLYQKVLILLVILAAYSFATIIIFNGHIGSAAASLRNVMTPMMFFLIGLLASHNVILNRFLKYISYITVFVVIYGLTERFLLDNIWWTFNLPELWEKKGLPLNSFTGLPVNFYSSEMVNGQQLRRMVSSFADPVNLGTFLFFSFLAAWYLKKKVLALVIVISIAIAVSKGAMLGLLVFSVVWSYNKLSKTGYFIVLLCAGFAGVAFILYSMANSTMSMFLHITGFFAAFPELIRHPLGRGLGNIGVLAGLYSNGAQTEITESGLGMIIGQLGIIGLFLFIYFFMILYKQSLTIVEKEDLILAQSLILGILLNIMFNEVALSPNSSAVYFITIGIILGKWYVKNGDILKGKKKKFKIVW